MVSAFKEWDITKYVTVIMEITFNHLTYWKKAKELKDVALYNGLGMIVGDIIGRIYFGRKYTDIAVGE